MLKAASTIKTGAQKFPYYSKKNVYKLIIAYPSGYITYSTDLNACTQQKFDYSPKSITSVRRRKCLILSMINRQVSHTYFKLIIFLQKSLTESAWT